MNYQDYLKDANKVAKEAFEKLCGKSVEDVFRSVVHEAERPYFEKIEQDNAMNQSFLDQDEEAIRDFLTLGER